MAKNGVIPTPDPIPPNTCMFVLEGGAYVSDGCNCDPGFEAPPPPEVTEPPESPIFVPCVPIEEEEEEEEKS